MPAGYGNQAQRIVKVKQDQAAAPTKPAPVKATTPANPRGRGTNRSSEDQQQTNGNPFANVTSAWNQVTQAAQNVGQQVGRLIPPAWKPPAVANSIVSMLPAGWADRAAGIVNNINDQAAGVVNKINGKIGLPTGTPYTRPAWQQAQPAWQPPTQTVANYTNTGAPVNIGAGGIGSNYMGQGVFLNKQPVQLNPPSGEDYYWTGNTRNENVDYMRVPQAQAPAASPFAAAYAKKPWVNYPKKKYGGGGWSGSGYTPYTYPEKVPTWLMNLYNWNFKG
jgi:hypothetical protein